MTTISEVIGTIAGQPTDAVQSFLLYLISVVVSLILIMYFLHIFKLIAGFINPRK